MKLIISIVISIIILITPIRVFSAEVLNVTSSSVLQIGDNNRNYKVRIACINIYNLKEKEAFEWLREELPRSSKINLLPKGSENGTLVAKVVKLKSSKDISRSMVEKGFGENECTD